MFEASAAPLPNVPTSYEQLLEHQSLSPHQFDSKSESLIAESLRKNVLGTRLARHLIPQVGLESLASVESQEINNTRVDFLLTGDAASIVIEVDDLSHQAHGERDKSRDASLSQAGFPVIRLTNEDVAKQAGIVIGELKQWCEINFQQREPTTPSPWEKVILASKIIHQLQVVAIEAFLRGHLTPVDDSVIFVDETVIPFTGYEAKQLLTIATDDLNQLLAQLFALYNGKGKVSALSFRPLTKNSAGNAIALSYGPLPETKLPAYCLQEVAFPKPISHEAKPQERETIPSVREKPLLYFLQYLFRYDKFMEGQYEAIARVMAGEDTILLLPTGAGKSIVYQLATLLLPGVGVVVDPIIALIDDQLDNLQAKGIDRAIGISSAITDARQRSRFMQLFGQGEYLLCYVAPERFQTEEFRGTVKSLTTHMPVCVIAIDEAHCVSEWGHDFRTSYLNIGRVTRDVCTWRGQAPPLIALTGTASYAVLRDVKRDLAIKDTGAIITPTSFDREELHFNVFACKSPEKTQLLKSILSNVLPGRFHISRTTFCEPRGQETYCGILFCPHVGGQYGIVEFKREVADSLNIPSRIYGGRVPAGFNRQTWPKEKQQTAKDFKNNKYPLLVATKSFGMGIDKPNIRYTIHIGLPQSIESFYQEAGRAGRGSNNGSRMNAQCTVLISNDNPMRSQQLLNPNSTTDVIRHILAEDRDEGDDITRAMWFHEQSFKGVQAEVKILGAVFEQLGNFEAQRRIVTTFPQITQELLASALGIKRRDAENVRRNIIEKALHRLVLLGIVNDYTIDYSADEFQVSTVAFDRKLVTKQYIEYVLSYNRGAAASERKKVEAIPAGDMRQFINGIAGILINFIYDHIEKGRRRAMQEMLIAAEEARISADGHQAIKDRILKYFQTTHSEEIERILAAPSEGLIEVRNLIDGDSENLDDTNYGGVLPPKVAADFRGQVSRYLESLPDHPGLLFLRAATELYCSNSEVQIVRQNMLAGISAGLTRANATPQDIHDMAGWMLLKVHERQTINYRELVSELLYAFNNAEFARTIIKLGDFNDTMIYEPSVYLFSRLSRDALAITSS